MKVKIHTLQFFTMFIYLCSLSAFQRDTLFESTLEIVSFAFFVGMTFLLHLNTDKKRMKINGMTIWYGTFIAFSALSALWAVYSSSAVFFYIKKMIQILMVSECISLIVRDKKDIESIFKVIIASLLFAGLLLISRTTLSEWGTKRAGLEIGLDENILGARMAIGLIASLYFFVEKRGKTYGFLMILFGLLVIMSGSKKAILMTIVGCFILYLCKKQGKGVLYYIPRIAVITAVLVIVIYAIFNIPMFYNVLGIRLERTITYFLSGRNTFDHSTSERLYYIAVAKQLFKGHPILGVGLNNFKEHVSTIYAHAAYSHNNYWELLSCLGIMGTVLFYTFHAKLLYKLFATLRVYKSDTMLFLMIDLLVILLVQDYASVTFMNIFQYIIVSLIYNYEKLCTDEIIVSKYRKQ